VTPRRPYLSMRPGEQAQVRRRLAFEAAHPEVQFASPGGMAQAHLTHGNKQVTITRPLMADLLDELDRLFPPDG
jgi:hypothetical protein